MGNFKNWSVPPTEKCCSAGKWAKQSAPRYIPKRTENMHHAKNDTGMFTAAFCLIPPKWKQPRCPSTDGWMNEVWSVQMKECYSAIKKILEYCYMVQRKWTSETGRWVKEARYKSPRVVGLRFYEIPRTGKSVESESGFVTKVWRVTTNRVGFLGGGGQGVKNCWNLDIPVGTLYNLMNVLKTTAFYTLMNLMVCEIHLNRIKKRGNW